MKKILLMAVMALFAVTAAQAQVQFTGGSLKDLQAKAKAENKYLFVDVFATWCGPCKYMDSKVFPDAKLGEYMNATFVNGKFDAEKGEGIDVAKTYRVSGYPTFLILDGDGKELGRLISGGEPEDFIKRLQDAVSKIK